MKKFKKFKYKLKWNLLSRYYIKLIKQNSKVLDFGAGDLYISKLIQDSCNCKIVGADIIDYGTDYVEKVTFTGNKLPFEDKSFDYVIVTEVLHHIEYDQQKAMLEELKRVAKQIVILEDAPNALTRLIDRFHNEGDMPVPLAFRNKGEWMKFLSKIGDVEYIEIKRPFWFPLKYYLMVIK